MNPDTGDVCFYNILEGFLIKSGDAVDYVQAFNNRIYALEMSGSNILIINFENNKCQYVPLNCNNKAWSNFVAFERYDFKFYIFPKYENKIVKCDTHNNSITEISNYLYTFTEIQCACRNENQVWLIPKNMKQIVLFDLQTNKAKYFEISRVLEDCVDAVAVGEVIYILNIYGIIYKWNTKNEELQELVYMETDHVQCETMHRIIYAGNLLILFPALGEDIKILNLSTNEKEIYRDYPQDFLYHELRWSKYYGYCEDEKYYYLAMRSSNYLLRIRKSDGKFFWVKYNFFDWLTRQRIREELIRNKIEMSLEKGNNIFYENEMSILNLLKFKLKRNCNNDVFHVGKRIYERML